MSFSQKDTTVFQDQTNPARVLILSTILFVDDPCRDPSLVYAHPLLVGPKIICRVTDDGEKVIYIGEIQSSKPYFDFQFFDQDDKNAFFIANGRLFPAGESGYVDVKRVSRADLGQDIQELLTEVPGFSGGMAHDQNHDIYFYNEATGFGTNRMHQIHSKKLRELIALKQSKRFKEVVHLTSSEFDGLSLNLKINREGDIFCDNGEYESFLINRDFKKQIVKIPEKCKLIGAEESNWLFSCPDHTIVKYTTRDLLINQEL